MFQVETEDMIPRIAPKPTSGPGLNEPAAMPSVPEVSILFNQQALPSTACSDSDTQQCKPQQTYASWKKSVLPKVIYPAVAENDASSSAPTNATQPPQNYAEVRSNVFPLRAAPPKNVHYSDSYRRSLESCIPNYSCAQDVHVVDSINPTLAHLQQQQHLRRSLDALPQQTLATPPTSHTRTRSQHSEVLTICAGTQTETWSPRSDVPEHNQQLLSMLLTKNDLKNLLDNIQELREEQQRLTRICTVLLEHQYQHSAEGRSKTLLKDVATQYDTKGRGEQQCTDARSQDHNANQLYETETPNILQHRVVPSPSQGVQSPRPAAHSTKYRQNTPRATNNQPRQQQQLASQQNHVLNIPATEQSLVMNELALKYLPNDKLNELMLELQLSSPSNQRTAETDENFTCSQGKTATTPLRNIDNFDKGPNDLSNASYKYLKKYRLLPELPQIEHITSMTPKPMRQNKNNYQRDQSPLAGPHCETHENMLDLDAIRRQPKFL